MREHGDVLQCQVSVCLVTKEDLLMKKRFLSSILVILMLTASIAGCGNGNSSPLGADLSDISGVPADEAAASVTVSSSGQRIERRTYPFRNKMNGGGNEDTINLYFVDGGEVPYVSLTEYMPRIGTLYENDDMGLPGVTYEITHPDDNNYVLARPDNSSQMTMLSVRWIRFTIGRNWSILFMACPEMFVYKSPPLLRGMHKGICTRNEKKAFF